MHVKFWNWSAQSRSLLAWYMSAMLSRLSPWTNLISGDSCQQLWKSYYGSCLQRDNFHTVASIMWKLPSIWMLSFLLNIQKTKILAYGSISSVSQFSPSVMSDSLRPHELSTPGLPVHHQLPEFTQTHVHLVGDAIQPSPPLSSPSPPAPNPSQHQSLFQWVNSSHEVAKVLEFQL